MLLQPLDTPRKNLSYAFLVLKETLTLFFEESKHERGSHHYNPGQNSGKSSMKHEKECKFISHSPLINIIKSENTFYPTLAAGERGKGKS